MTLVSAASVTGELWSCSLPSWGILRAMCGKLHFRGYRRLWMR